MACLGSTPIRKFLPLLSGTPGPFCLFLHVTHPGNLEHAVTLLLLPWLLLRVPELLPVSWKERGLQMWCEGLVCCVRGECAW